MAKRRSIQKFPKQKKINTKYLKLVFAGILFAGIVFVITNKTLYFFKTADLFTIKEIVKAPSLRLLESRHLMRLRGTNIFDVDLKVVQKRLQSQYPKIKQLRVFRRFPDKIYVTAKKRKPFALLTVNKKNILIDKDGVVLSVNASPNPKLPSISGVRRYQKMILGMPLKRRELDVAIEIIKAVQGNRALASFDIVTMDVSNLSEIYFHLANHLKVIVDKNKIYKKIRSLGIVLSQGNLDLQDINYVDLRFKEPILGKK